MSYHVVTLERDDPLVRRHKFHQLGSDLVRENMMRVRDELRRSGGSSFLKELPQVEMYTFGECLPGYEDTVPGWLQMYLPTPEYRRFGKVYFLNDLALRMYREGGVEFEVAEGIADGDLPEGVTRCLSAPYLPP